MKLAVYMALTLGASAVKTLAESNLAYAKACDWPPQQLTDKEEIKQALQTNTIWNMKKVDSNSGSGFKVSDELRFDDSKVTIKNLSQSEGNDRYISDMYQYTIGDDGTVSYQNGGGDVTTFTFEKGIEIGYRSGDGGNFRAARTEYVMKRVASDATQLDQLVPKTPIEDAAVAAKCQSQLDRKQFDNNKSYSDPEGMNFVDKDGIKKYREQTPEEKLVYQAEMDAEWVWISKVLESKKEKREAWDKEQTGDKSDEAYETFLDQQKEENEKLSSQDELSLQRDSATSSQAIDLPRQSDISTAFVILDENDDFYTEATDAFYKVSFYKEEFKAVVAVRVRSSMESFKEAQFLESATIRIGQEECGSIPSGVIDHDTWIKVVCSKRIIGNSVTITRKDRLAFSNIEVIENDNDVIDPEVLSIAKNDLNKAEAIERIKLGEAEVTATFSLAKAGFCQNDATSRDCVRGDQYRDDRMAFNTEKDFYNQKSTDYKKTLDEEFTSALEDSKKKFIEENTSKDQDVLTLSTLAGSQGVQGSIPGDATDGKPDTEFSTADEGKPVFWSSMLDTMFTVNAVRVRTSNIFSQAVKLQSAKIFIGTTQCGNVPAEVNEATWYRVNCDAPITSNSVKIESVGGLVFSQIEVLKAKLQDADGITIALFDARPAPPTGGLNFRCEKDGVTEESKRPGCNDGLCCGHAFDPEATDEVRLQVETCQDQLTVTYMHEPTWDSTPKEWTFQCIEGASFIGATAAAYLAFISQN